MSSSAFVNLVLNALTVAMVFFFALSVRLTTSLRTVTRSTSCPSSTEVTTLAHLSVRRHDTLIGVFCSALHGPELISAKNQLSPGFQRHQQAFRSWLTDVELVKQFRELHRN